MFLILVNQKRLRLLKKTPNALYQKEETLAIDGGPPTFGAFSGVGGISIPFPRFPFAQSGGVSSFLDDMHGGSGFDGGPWFQL